jgi:hypothetical protein
MTIPLAGHAKASQTTGPTLSSSASPANIRPPPIRKPSFIVQGLFHINYIILESFIVFRGVGEATIDETYELYSSSETELFVTGSVDILIEQVLNAVFLEIESRDKLIVATQRNFVL